VHKGYASQSRTLGHLANPADVEKAALDHPDLTFIIYHSALKHGPYEPEFKQDGFFDPTTGDFAWHDVLMKLKERNPRMNNVYPEIGSSFGSLAIQHPIMCQHLIGKNIKHYGADHVVWGTDCLWWGSPQWVIEAFKRFQISDELCEKFGYQKLTKDDKAKIFGLNAAKIYGVDVNAQRKAFPADTMSKLKQTPAKAGNAECGLRWVREDVEETRGGWRNHEGSKNTKKNGYFVMRRPDRIISPYGLRTFVFVVHRSRLHCGYARFSVSWSYSPAAQSRGLGGSRRQAGASFTAMSACFAIAWMWGRSGRRIATDKTCVRPPGL
jgi:hypothetical protein